MNGKLIIVKLKAEYHQEVYFHWFIYDGVA